MTRFEILQPLLSDWLREVIVFPRKIKKGKKDGKEEKIAFFVKDATIPRILREVNSFALSIVLHSTFEIDTVHISNCKEIMFFFDQRNLIELFPGCTHLVENLISTTRQDSVATEDLPFCQALRKRSKKSTSKKAPSSAEPPAKKPKT